MDKNPGSPEKGSEFNKIDLSAFEDFSFGTQWSPATDPSDIGPADRRDRRGESGPGGGRDRRPPRRFPPKDDDSRSRGGPRGGGGEGGEREGAGGGSQRGVVAAREGGPRPDRRGPPRDFGGAPVRHPMRDQLPYESRILEVAFYPEEHGFNALVKAMRNSCRTYELFEIARLILEKLERSVVVFRRLPDETGNRPQLAVSIPDGLPFETEDEAIQHVLAHHMGVFFEVGEVETEAPKGNFQIVHRCPVTKELLGPPNYHRYAAIVEQHHAAHVSHLPLERYKGSLISSREPEDIQAWLEKMKKTVRYSSKADLAEEAGVFDSPEEARTFLLRVARAKMVKAGESTRIDAKEVQKYPETEAARAMEGALERQRRFPLDTANALRGRLRRENFHIFKRGSKGITFACSVRRKYRIPGQTFSDSVEELIGYLEANPLTPIGALPERFLGIPIHGNAAAGQEGTEVLPDEKKETLKKMAMDLRWLVTEGYVAEFSDGRLLAAPSESRPPEKETRAKAPPQKKPSHPSGEPEASTVAGSGAGAVHGAADEAATGDIPAAVNPEAPSADASAGQEGALESEAPAAGEVPSPGPSAEVSDGATAAPGADLPKPMEEPVAESMSPSEPSAREGGSPPSTEAGAEPADEPDRKDPDSKSE